MLAGPKIMVEGAAGSGKSYSVGTLVEWAEKNNCSVHVIYTENSFETLLKYFSDRKRELPACLRWHIARVPSIPLASLINSAELSGKLTYEGLTKMSDPTRATNNPWEKLLRIFVDVPDDRTGKKFGDITEWGPDRILVIDSFSEMAVAAFRMITGNKPVASQPDYLAAQTQLLNFMRFLTQTLQCTFVLTAHVQRQINEVLGTTQLMTKAIGKAIADEIPPLFSEVLYAVRDGTNWYWDTIIANVDSKTRYLPRESKIRQDFAQIMDAWRVLATSAASQQPTK